MGLINYKDIDLKKSINNENKTINFNGQEIQIVNYLSINDKYDLVMITLQKSFEKGIYNLVKLDMYFELNVIYSYTNIVFDNDDRHDEAALYDTMKRSGLIDAVIAEIDENELNLLKNYIDDISIIIMRYRNTFGAVVESFIEQLPKNMEAAKEIIETFDPEKMKSLTDLAGQLKAGVIID